MLRLIVVVCVTAGTCAAICTTFLGAAWWALLGG
jgi:hypothetical protein